MDKSKFLKQWRTLILGKQVVIIVYHISLHILITCQFKNPRITRLTLLNQEFDYDIRHLGELKFQNSRPS